MESNEPVAVDGMPERKPLPDPNDRDTNTDSIRYWNACLDAVSPLIAGLRADLASANADKEAYGQNAIDLRKRVDTLRAEVERMKQIARDAADAENKRIDSLINELTAAYKENETLRAANVDLLARLHVILACASGDKNAIR